MRKKYFVLAEAVLLLFVLAIVCAGCSARTSEKVRDLEFTVVSEELLPEKVAELILEKKNEAFDFTYTDHENLYLCVGYGRQNTGGYSIVVDDLYLTGENVYVNTTLLGPKSGERKTQTPSYPVLVIKTEYIEKPVIFH